MSFWKRACCRRRSAVGRFLGFFVSAVLIKLLKVGLYLSLFFNDGGLKPLLDIRKRARIGWRSNIGGCSSANSGMKWMVKKNLRYFQVLLTNRRDSNSPDIAKLVVSTFSFYCSDFRGHPIQEKTLFVTKFVLETETISTYQYGVPIKLLRLFIVAVICAETPKSANFTSPLSVNRIFAPLISRCIFPIECK